MVGVRAVAGRRRGAVSFALVATARKNSSASSASKPAIATGGRFGIEAGRTGVPRCRSRRSPAPRPSAPRRGRSGGCRMRSPSATSSAWPRAMPTSSTVWWAPVSRSPRRLDREAEAAVAAEQLEHVIEEADARSRLDTSPPSRSSATRDVGLAGLAVDLGGSGHSGIEGSGSSPRSGLGRLAVHGEALGPRQRRDARGEPVGRRRADRDDRGPAPERRGAERPAEAGGAAGRQHVVGTRGVVAEGDRRRPGRRRRSRRCGRRRGARRRLERKLEVLGRERVGELERPPSSSGASTSASGASRDVGRSAASPRPARSTRSRAPRASGEIATSEAVGAVLGLGAGGRGRAAAARRCVERRRLARSARRSRRSRPRRRPAAWPRSRSGCPGPAMTSTGATSRCRSASAAIAWAPPTA